jgi:PST family polysaccharide transporter
MVRVLASNVVIHASGAIAPAVALSALLRRVGFGEFGAVLACQTLVSLFVGVSDLGCSLLGLQRVARRHHCASAAATLRGVRLFSRIRFTSTLVFSALLVAYMAVFKRDQPALILPAVGLFFAQGLTPTWALLALEATHRNALHVVLSRTVWVALAVAFVHRGVTYLWLILLLNSALLFFTVRCVEKTLGARIHLVQTLRAWRFYAAVRATVGFSASRIGVNVYQAAPLLILSHIGSSMATGIYATIETLHKVYVTATHPVTDALFGRTARVRSAQPFVRYGVPLLGLFLVSLVIVGIEADRVLAVIGGGRAAGAAPQLRLILVATSLSVISVFVGYPLAGGMGRVDAVNRTTLVSPFVLFLTLCITFVWTRDALRSAIVALIVTEASILALRLAVVRAIFRGPIDTGPT